MSIPNCQGCQVELDAIEEMSVMGFHFAGKGLYEKGHLLMFMVDDKGEWVAG